VISARADKVASLLERFSQFRLEAKLNDQLRNRGDELEETAAHLEVPSRQVALLRDHGWLDVDELPTTDIEKQRVSITKIRDLLLDEPREIDKIVQRLVAGCGKVVEKVATVTQSAWDKVVARQSPVVSEPDLKRVEQFQSETQKIAEIRRLKAISVSHVPSDLAALHEIEKRWERLRELIGSLPRGSDHPEVIRFLDAVRKRGAPLALLTDAVRKYLDDEGKFDAFRIYQDR